MQNHASRNIAATLLAVGKDDAAALLHRGAITTYAALREGVTRVAAALASAGCRPSDQIGLAAENSRFFVEAYLGAIWAGMVIVPFQAGVEEETFRAIVESTGMRHIFLQGKQGAGISAWASALGLTLWPAADLAAQLPDESRRAAAASVDARLIAPAPVDPATHPAAIVFTSGSTGKPKGVVISHQNIESNTRDIVGYLGLTEADRMFAVLPLSYCYGASLLHTHLAVGASVALASSFMFPEKALDEMEAAACTGLAGVPSTFQILLRKSKFGQRKFPRLRVIQQAGGRLPNPFIRELRSAHPTASLFIMYGQTEATARLSYLPPDLLDTKLGSIGRGLASLRLDVVGADGRSVGPGSGEVGEIVASGPNIALGYWKDPEETARFFREGRLHTGDLATIDADGYIFIVDRARDFIKSMGNRVSAKEVEEVICEHPEVVEVAVIGVPDDTFGEAIWAYVVGRRPGLAEAEIRSFCTRHLPNHKAPQRVVVTSQLPKSEQGKVQKARLREIAAAERAAGGTL